MKGASLALLLSDLLNNPNLPTDLYNSIMRGLADMSNDLSHEYSVELEKYETSPEYIADLLEYHAEEKPEQKEVLDLSEMCGEFLRTNEATAGEKTIPLSVLLSAVMKHPDMPTKLYNVLTDEICEVPEGFYEQPETIQHTLDVMKAKESEENA